MFRLKTSRVVVLRVSFHGPERSPCLRVSVSSCHRGSMRGFSRHTPLAVAILPLARRAMPHIHRAVLSRVCRLRHDRTPAPLHRLITIHLLQERLPAIVLPLIILPHRAPRALLQPHRRRRALRQQVQLPQPRLRRTHRRLRQRRPHRPMSRPRGFRTPQTHTTAKPNSRPLSYLSVVSVTAAQQIINQCPK